MNNLDVNIEIFVEKAETKEQESWGKCLRELPLFTIKEIEHFRIKSGKRKAGKINIPL